MASEICGEQREQSGGTHVFGKPLEAENQTWQLWG